MKNVKTGILKIRGQSFYEEVTKQVVCFVLQAKDFFLYLFISKKSRLFGSKSFLNSETETTKDYVANKTVSFRNLLKCFRIRRNSQIKFRGLK